MTEILKADTDADFLSLVPELAGYTARNSIVVVAFGGTRAWAAFRLDLPPRRRLADYRAVSTQVLAMLDRLPHTDGAAVVVYTDEGFEHGIPWRDLAVHVTDRLRREGFDVPTALCVAADGWAGYFERDRPVGGHPLALIRPRTDLPDIAEWSALPAVTDLEREEFLDELVELREAGWPEELASVAEGGPIATVEAILAWEGVIPLTLGVELIDLACSPAHRDVIMLQVAFGEIVAEAVERDNERYLALQRRSGATMDDVVRAEVAAGRTAVDDELTGLLLGRGQLRPDAERIDRMVPLLRHLIAVAPETLRPGPLCVLAWLLWCRGLGSAAHVFIEQALAIEPAHGMADILRTITAHGRMPEWAFG